MIKHDPASYVLQGQPSFYGKKMDEYFHFWPLMCELSTDQAIKNSKIQYTVDPRVLLGLDPGPGSMVKTRVRVLRTRVLESLTVIERECTIL